MKIFLVVFCFTFILSGCFVPNSEYTPVVYYDLKLPNEIALKNIDFKILPFRNSCCPTKQRMVVRDDIQVFIDDYNKWIQSPGVLIQKYLKLTFSSPKNNKNVKTYYITGDVVLFEADKKHQNSVLSIEYIISDENHNKLITVSETFVTKTKDFSAKSFVLAMSENALQLVKCIKKDLMTL